MAGRSPNSGAWAACIGLGAALTLLTIPIGLGVLRLCVHLVEKAEEHLLATHGIPRREPGEPRSAGPQPPVLRLISIPYQEETP